MTFEKYVERHGSHNSPAFALVRRCVEQFEANGYDVSFINGIGDRCDDKKDGDRLISVKEVYRSNGTAEDVTARIEVYEQHGIWLHVLLRTKVPAKASDKVVQNRVNKAIEAFNA